MSNLANERYSSDDDGDEEHARLLVRVAFRCAEKILDVIGVLIDKRTKFLMRRRVVLLTDEIANVLDAACLREKIIFEALEEKDKQRRDEKRSVRRLRKHLF